MSHKYKFHDDDKIYFVTYANCNAYPNKTIKQYQFIMQEGFVTKEENWKYISANNFYGIEGLVSLNYN